jgi:uncharacterized membrane protein
VAHVHDAPAEMSRRTRRALAIIAGLLGVATLAGMVLLWPTGETHFQSLGLISTTYEADVVGSTNGPCAGTTEADNVPCERVRFRLHDGPDEGKIRVLEFPESETKPEFEDGEDVVLAYDRRSEPGFRYQFADRQRRPVLLGLVIVFAAAVILLGRLRGVAALLGLGASIAILVAFILPALLQGHDPVLVAIVGSSAVAFLALYLAHGLNTMTTVALLGTLAALSLTVALAALFTDLANFSGLATEEALLIRVGDQGIDLTGLILAGMVIGALGALDDVTVTQASAVWELRATDPTLTRRDLYRAGLRIGRDHIASTVNTLALAYAGAALPLLILLVVSRQSLGSVANSEVVAIEIVTTLVGSIGLVAAVPVTTWLAAEVAGNPPRGAGEHEPEPQPEPTSPALREAKEIDEDEFWSR